MYVRVRLNGNDRCDEQMGKKMSKITFRPEGEEPVDFYVLEQTVLGGVSYILVTDVEEGDADAFILKDLSELEDEDSIYEIVSEETELLAVATVFESLLEDVELIEGN